MKKTPPKNAGPKYQNLLPVALIFLVLAVLFFRSFLPNYIHFNNDGPLGQQNTEWLRLPAGFTGLWNDLNDTGYSGGAFSPSISSLVRWFIGPLGIAKFYAMIGLFILGLGAWTFFRCLKMTPMAATLGALAITMTGNFFGGACWSVAALEIAMGMNFLALALVVSNTPETRQHVSLIRYALAGICVGMNVMEAADVGALCSVFIAIFIVYRTMVEGTGHFVLRAVKGCAYAGVVAVFAGFLAIQAIVSLIGTNITGIAGTAQDQDTKQSVWDKDTQFSLAKKETLGFIVPGLFGYKMDTPNDIDPWFQKYYGNGVYWGSAGRDPAIDRYLDSGGTNPPPGGMRFGYGGYYCGILVLLVAFWTIAQSLRRKNSPFSAQQKYFIWFWAIVMVCSMPLAWGRFAPMFYGVPYHLIPYFSTIRNPSKFLNFFCWALAVLFAYGVNQMNRRYLDSAGPRSSGLVTQLQTWWTKTGSFDRKWVYASLAAVLASLIGWVIFNKEMPEFVQYLQLVGFSGEDVTVKDSAAAVAAFSVHQAAWFVGLLVVAAGLVTLTIAGYFSGQRARLGIILLGGFMIFDLSRADIPWVVHWDYKKKYEVGTLNPVEDFLRQKPYEYRVTGLPFEPQQQLPGYDYLFGGMGGIYRIEWTQHHFLYYDIQCLDLIMMPRMPEDMEAYHDAFMPEQGVESQLPMVTRHWELTNTRYILGAAGFINVLNSELDPGHNRYRIAMRFDIVPKPGIDHLTGLPDFTAVTNADGQLALFDFTGALPRAQLYGNWQVNTNDQVVLKTLADPNFDPHNTVMVSSPQAELPASATNANTGTVEIKKYSSKIIDLAANATTPSVLLLNDRYDPSWAVTVDGQPAKVLRCNYEMRGVYLQPGQHNVEFSFYLPSKTLYVTTAALIVGILLGGVLWLTTRKTAGGKTA